MALRSWNWYKDKPFSFQAGRSIVLVAVVILGLVTYQQHNRAQEGRIQAQEGRIQAQEGSIQAQEGRLQAQEGRLQAQEGRLQAQEGRLQAQERAMQSLGVLEVTFVIASCASNLTWADPLLDAGYAVVVIEKCRQAQDGSTAVKNKVRNASRQRTMLFHVDISELNRGREAHTYLWYIINYWDQLSSVVFFLQGDAHLHIHRKISDKAAYLQHTALDFISQRLSYQSLSNDKQVVPSFPKHGSFSSTARSFCNIFTKFVHTNGTCYGWVAARFAHFVVARRTIKKHPKSAYQHLLRKFEDDALASQEWHPYSRGAKNDSSGLAQVTGAVVLETSWNLIFGCSRLVTRKPHVNCSFGITTWRADGKRVLHHCEPGVATTWRIMNSRSPAPKRENFLAFDEENSNSCRKFHDIAAEL